MAFSVILALILGNARGELVEEITVDLALPPRERFAAYIPRYKDKVAQVLAFVQSQIPSFAFTLLTYVLGDLDTFIGQPYADEMRGLADVSGYPLGDVVLLNTFYELTVGCTSILAVNTANGSCVHGRNLDFPVDHLGPITLNARFVRGDPNVTLYRATLFAGYVGVLTGLKPASPRKPAWSFSLDQRDTDGGAVMVWVNALEAMLRGGRLGTLLVREMMDATGTPGEYGYDDALRALSTTHLSAPAYLIVGSATGGAVVARDREAAADVWVYDAATANASALVETNYDHWLPPPDDDDRRTPAYAHLREIGSAKYGVGSVEQGVMARSPNLNGITVYTTMMEVGAGAYYTIRRQDEVPGVPVPLKEVPRLARGMYNATLAERARRRRG